MSRTEKVLEKARKAINEGQKPSVSQLSRDLGWAEPDVHRCLNSLEREGTVKTYSKEVFGQKHRFVGLNR